MQVKAKKIAPTPPWTEITVYRDPEVTQPDKEVTVAVEEMGVQTEEDECWCACHEESTKDGKTKKDEEDNDQAKTAEEEAYELMCDSRFISSLTFNRTFKGRDYRV